MNGKIQKFLLGASVVAGVSAIATTPALAASITGASITGTAPNDFEVWDVDPNITCPAEVCLGSKGTDTSNLIGILGGTAPKPGGNVELFKSSETLALPNFLSYGEVTSLDVDFDDNTSVIFSSLTAKDLFGEGLETSYTADTVATKWFDDAFDANLAANNIDEKFLFTGLSFLTGGKFNDREDLYNAFLTNGGFQRTVDPNIAYVTKNGNEVGFGLAGHTNLLFYADKDPALKAALDNLPFELTLRASELVKVSYSDQEDILYSFKGSPSNVASADNSFSFTYDDPFEVNVPPGDPTDPPASVPEPSAILGLMAVGGLFAAQRKLKKS
ncbi:MULTISPECIES: NF038130 family PEP-CTERM protein [unclassified Coleofasciculus]|uniref:NF038130 family PEP-CTERM protein n=1 Tax=unclassified Coleofasciculus TaxID=2692782 RepID=UPI00187E483E|nr:MULTISPECIES: NF038130 family PEP-CTERM protein [unclassified Coleofasciculus]MBE9128357.1 NF038130 family PEP-CTERM protein [Coleofasciculus sp. LEGE 07081]MBE9151413.1 NF038130 family PEP-CTERM protein [Coleofasciculus sp. LEGE 07092]